MADGLKLSQLSTMLAQQGLQGTAFNPGMQAYMQSLVGSGQSAIQAEAQKKAEKKKKGSGLDKLLGTAGTIAGAAVGGPVGAGIGGSLGTAAGQAVGGGEMDFGQIASTGVSAGMGGFMPGMGGASAQMNPSPTAPNITPAPAPGTPKIISPLASVEGGITPAQGTAPAGSPGTPGGVGVSGAPAPAPTPSAPTGTAIAPAPTATPSTASGGGGAGDLMKYAPLIGAGVGALTGGKEAYNSPVSAPASMQTGGGGGGILASSIRGRNFEGMSPQELKKFMKSDPTANQAVMGYLQGGGAFTPDQAAAIPRDMKKVYRSAGLVGMPSSGEVTKERIKKALMGLAVGYGVSGGFGGNASKGQLVPTGAGTYDYQ